MEVIALKNEIIYQQDEVSKKLLYDSPQVRFALFCLEAGQEISPHQTSSAVSLYVIEGEANLTGEGEGTAISSGNLVLYKPSEMHGFKANKKTTILATITPRP